MSRRSCGVKSFLGKVFAESELPRTHIYVSAFVALGAS